MAHRDLAVHGGVQTLTAFGAAVVALLMIFVPLDGGAMTHSTWARYAQEVHSLLHRSQSRHNVDLQVRQQRDCVTTEATVIT